MSDLDDVLKKSDSDSDSGPDEDLLRILAQPDDDNKAGSLDLNDDLDLDLNLDSFSLNLDDLDLDFGVHKYGESLTTIFQDAIKGRVFALRDADPKLLRRACTTARDHQGRTILTAVCEEFPANVVEVLEILLENGSAEGLSTDIGDERGSTALHYACEHANLEVIRILLDHGAPADARTSRGQSPLHALIGSENVKSEEVEEIVQLLLRAGAQPGAVESSKNCSYLAVDAMVDCLKFREDQTSLSEVNRDRLHAMYSVLEMLFREFEDREKEIQARKKAAKRRAEKSKDKEDEEDEDGLVPLEPMSLDLAARPAVSWQLNRIEGDMTPLALLVRLIIILQRAKLKGERDLVPRVNEELALNNFLRAARLMIDKGANLHIKFEEGSQGSILSAIIRNEVQLLVVHPKVQHELNTSWGPEMVYQSRYGWYDNNTGYSVDWKELPKLHLKSRRASFILSACTYFFWMVLITTVALRTYTGNGVDEYFMANDVRERYVYDELNAPYMMSFSDIAARSDIPYWIVGGPLTTGATSPYFYDSGTPLTIRVFRYNLKTTEADPVYKFEESDCIEPAFNAPKLPFIGSASNTITCTRAFIPGTSSEYKGPDKAGIKYVEPKDNTKFLGRLGLYYPESGGYVLEVPPTGPVLPADPAYPCSGLEAASTLECLINNITWLDQTAAVFIAEQTVFNPNLRRFALIRMVIEFPISGALFPWKKVDMMFVPYHEKIFEDEFTRANVIMEIIILLLWLMNLLREGKQFFEDKWGYLRDKWNYNDIMVIGLIGIVVIYRIVSATKALDASDSLVFFEMQQTANIQQAERQVASVLLIFLWLGTLKFVRFYPDIGILLRIIKKEIRDVIVFLLVYFALLLGFAVAFSLLLGSDAPEYRTLWLAVVAMARMTTGDFDFGTIEEADRWMAMVLFFLFLVASTILLLNLLIAMLNQSYANVLEQSSFEYLAERAKLIASYDEARLETADVDWSRFESKDSGWKNLDDRIEKMFEEPEKKDDEGSQAADDDPVAGAPGAGDDAVEMQTLSAGDDKKKPKKEAPKSVAKMLEEASGGTFLRSEGGRWSDGKGVFQLLREDPFTIDQLKVTSIKLTHGKPEDFLRNLYTEAKVLKAESRPGADGAKKKKKDESWDSDVSHADEDHQPRTAHKANAWVQVDIGEDNRAYLSNYKMVNFTPEVDSAPDIYPRHWVLQATNDAVAASETAKNPDPNDTRWATLVTHADDSSLCIEVDRYVSWPINWTTPTDELVGFRFLRVMMTGSNEFEDWMKKKLRWEFDDQKKKAFQNEYSLEQFSSVFTFCGLEFYGALLKGASGQWLAQNDFNCAALEELVSGDEQKRQHPAEDAVSVAPSAGAPAKRETKAQRLLRERNEAKSLAERKARAGAELVNSLTDDNQRLLQAVSNQIGEQLAAMQASIDTKLEILANKVRAVESSVSYIESHSDFGDYTFVYDAAES